MTLGWAQGSATDREIDDPDAVTVVIPLPRASQSPHPSPHPLVQHRYSTTRHSRLRGVLVWLTAAVAVVMAGISVVVVARALTAPAAVTAGAPGHAQDPAPMSAASPPGAESGTASAPVSGSCPSADQVLAVFAQAAPAYGAGARATSEVTCAGGFAVMSLRSPSTPDGLRTIYALGPPLRHLNSGTGPICSDNGSEKVTVPRSVAETLDCITSGGSGFDDTSSRDTSGSGAAVPSVADPFGCLAERAAQERSFDTDNSMPNSALTCNYNYGPTLPSTREQCWLAHYDLQDGSGFIDDRARRDYEEGCSRFGY